MRTICDRPGLIRILVVAIAFVAVAAHGGHDHHEDHSDGHQCGHHHHHDHHDHHHHHDGPHHTTSHEHTGSHSPIHERRRTLFETLVDGTVGSLLTSVAPIAVIPMVALFGGASKGRHHNKGGGQQVRLLLLTALAAGAIIADSLSHYPAGGLHDHDGEHGHDDHAHDAPPAVCCGLAMPIWYMMGFVAFFVVDGTIGAGGEGVVHSHAHSHGNAAKVGKKLSKPQQGPEAGDVSVALSSRAMLSLLADFTHNVTDGAVLGISALSSPAAMYRRVASLIAHELPHEVGDYAVLSQCGWSLRAILLSQVATAIGSWVGCVSIILLKFLATETEDSTNFFSALEALVGGSFLYLGAVVLVADLSRQLQQRSVLLKVLVAVAFFGGVQALEAVHVLEDVFG